MLSQSLPQNEYLKYREHESKNITHAGRTLTQLQHTHYQKTPNIKRYYLSGRTTTQISRQLSPIVDRMSKSELQSVQKGGYSTKKRELENIKEELCQFSKVRLEIKRRWGILDTIKKSGRKVSSDIEMQCLYE